MTLPLAPIALSIIMPVLNEGDIVSRLEALAPIRADGVEIIVVDGGSVDGTFERAALLADKTIRSPRGRAVQMNAGAAIATGDALLFLHADTILPSGAPAAIRDGLANDCHAWGRFEARIEGEHPLLPVVAFMMNLRSRLSGIATGDQAIFVRRDVFVGVGGFPDIALMEDIAFSRVLKRVSPPACLTSTVVTSGRRWDANGFWRTILLMWRLRLQFFLGADPDHLARSYGYRPRER